MSDRIELRYIEFRPRPKKDGLHESGYRHIQLTGVDMDGGRHDLGEWHDHLLIETSCNIDVEPDGTIRIMPWGRAKPFFYDQKVPWFYSTAWIHPSGEFQ